VARGESTAASDLDIAVLYEHEPPATLAGSGLVLAGELEKHTSRPVDLVVMNKAPADLVHRVLRDGQLLFDYAPSLRIRFEVKRRAEFIDLLPYLREYRRFNPERLR
jgi:predicted nucleotidyltransferase